MRSRESGSTRPGPRAAGWCPGRRHSEERRHVARVVPPETALYGDRRVHGCQRCPDNVVEGVIAVAVHRRHLLNTNVALTTQWYSPGFRGLAGFGLRPLPGDDRRKRCRCWMTTNANVHGSREIQPTTDAHHPG